MHNSIHETNTTFNSACSCACISTKLSYVITDSVTWQYSKLCVSSDTVETLANNSHVIAITCHSE